MTRYVSRAQLARELKVSRASITNAISAGRISSSAMTPGGAWLDADRAAEQFRATSSRSHPPALPRPAWSRAPSAPTPPAAPEPTAPSTPERAESLARRDAARAQLAEMQAAERSGELISAEAAKATWASVAGIVKTALMAVPSKAKQEIPRLTLEEVAVLEELIREALEEVADAAPGRQAAIE